TGDPVGAEQDHVQRMAPLPGQALLRVVGRPHVEGGEGVDRAAVADREMTRDLGPGADANAIRLVDLAISQKRVGSGFTIAPDALLERPGELGAMRFADELSALMVE